MILGQHSVSELKLLLKNKDSELADMQKAFASFGPSWSKSDPATFSAWSSDYDNLKRRYGMASVEAKAEIIGGEMVPLLSDDNIPAETGYQAVIGALQAQSGVVNKGDLQDLFNRLQAAQTSQGQATYTETPLTQEEKGHDTDLNVLQVATKAQDVIDAAAKKTKPSATTEAVLIVGGVAVGLLALKVALSSVRL